ncbi:MULTISPECIES: lipopolysaccharide assembly protein LapB [Vibrio]|uniref:tetratricopeptide repeat protein n=1 Tax=Vibrio TaxID=662 RepID=UPI0003090796|nr:secretion protein [Vibrio tasmaniensis]OEF91058.1 secretion protein [Vibrio tasmaniensis 1F-155]PMO81564.1 secretion protein [Vibrio tasmaniensis]
MFKKIIALTLVLMLAACSSTQASWQKDKSKEAIYQKTHNYVQLTRLYKNQLQQYDADEVREKLSNTYLAMGDAESALFYIAPVTQKPQPSVNSLLMQAKAYGELGQYPAAISSAKQVLVENATHAAAENLLGTFYGYSYQFDLSRRYFERAREHFYDSVSVNNNLAVLDITQEHYQAAMERLLPLYKRGQMNEQMMANLTLSMAKLGHYPFVESVLSERYSKHQIQKIYQALRHHTPYSLESQTLAVSGLSLSEEAGNAI